MIKDRNIFITSVLLYAISVAAVAQTPEFRPDPSNPGEKFSIDPACPLLVVPIKLNKKTYLFAIDTGSTHVIYDKSLRQELGQPCEATSLETPSGSTQIELFNAPDAFMGSINIKTKEKVACVDLGAARNSCGRDLRGFIGMSFLKNHILKIDFENMNLCFINKCVMFSGLPVSVSYQNPGYPIINVYVENLGRRDFVFDTGANMGITLEIADFTNLVNKGNIEVTGLVKNVEMIGSTIGKRGILTNASVNTIKIRNVSIGECTTSRIRIGLDLIKRYNVILDFKNDVIYLDEFKTTKSKTSRNKI